MVEAKFSEKYQLISKIGSGSFGEIYLAKDSKNGIEVAAKVELITENHKKSQLRREAKIYKLLYNEVGIPVVKWFGANERMNILTMDLLGKSLEDLFNYCDRKFTLKTVLVLAYEMLSRIECVHSKGITHRDIKPENFLMGRGRDRHTVYLIDFGLAKYYKNPANNKHIPLRDGYSLTGTARYASIGAHEGLEQSRRDDLYSIGYVLLYFLVGSLPWQGLHAQGNVDKYQLICEKKKSITTEQLCEGIPEEFRQYFDHLNVLQFEDTPDYAYLKSLFRDLFTKKRFTHDNILFDWEVLAYERQKEAKKAVQQESKKIVIPIEQTKKLVDVNKKTNNNQNDNNKSKNTGHSGSGKHKNK